MDVDELAYELYGLPPERFTETRNQRAKELQASGDRQGAESVRKLAKPSVAAWLANMLVRSRPELLDELLSLGQSLRRAQQRGAGDDIRSLSGRRQDLIRRMAEAAREEADTAGHPLGPLHQRQLEETLEAAVADESAASDLRAGRLTEAMSHVGFGELSAVERIGRTTARAPSASKTTSTQAPAERDHRSEARRRAAAKAAEALDKANAELQSAETAVAAAHRRHDEASEARRQTARALQEVERELKASALELDRSQRRRQRANDAVKKADRERRRLT